MADRSDRGLQRDRGRCEAPEPIHNRTLRTATATAVGLAVAIAVTLGRERPLVAGPRPGGRVVDVRAFLPADFKTDGSVSYQEELQRALDEAKSGPVVLRFPQAVFRITDPAGLRVHSHTTLLLHGVTFVVAETVRRDGQVFVGRDVRDVTFVGGRIIGRRDHWPDSVNVAGVRFYGRCRQLRFRDMVFEALSRNAIGLFGAGPQAMIEDVWVENVVGRDCCNVYIDYLQPGAGPVEGSKREDQGILAFYFVRNFLVRGCTLERSRSDGTHFYRCVDGRFVANRVLESKMGGYFVETSSYIVASNNIIRGNGSRGVTIERGSRFCTLTGNVIEDSGREGLWAPESSGLVIVGNIFRRNGRKDHGILDGEIMIDKSAFDPSKTPRAEDYLIANNLFITGAGQDATIRVRNRSRRIVIRGNVFLGPTRLILVGGRDQGVEDVVVEDNVGATVRRLDRLTPGSRRE